MKKGFTLIELLAVIVIIAIIALIATPIVLSIINETKISSLKRSSELYIDALELTIAKAKIGFAILFNPIPQARITVISELRLNPFNVITVASNTPIGIVITKTDGKCKMIIINAYLNGIPYLEICLIRVINVSEANIMDVNTNTPIINIVITCLKIYLSTSFILLYLTNNFIIKFFTKGL